MSLPPSFADAVWGFMGATVYAAGTLAACLWAGETEPTPRQRRLCYGRTIVRIMFGTTAAAALTATVHSMVGWAELHAIAFVIGGSINEVWSRAQNVVLARLSSVAGAIFNTGKP